MPEATQVSERAVAIQEGLYKKEPDNREYKMELAQFYFTLANLFRYEDHLDLAEQRNRQALALFDELVKPASSISKERAKAQALRDWLLK
jgi:hypothetical protein